MKEGDIVLHDGKLKEVDWLRTRTLVVKDMRTGECTVTVPECCTPVDDDEEGGDARCFLTAATIRA